MKRFAGECKKTGGLDNIPLSLYRKYNIKVVVFKVLVMKHAFTWVCIIRNVTGNVVRPVVNFKCLKYYTRL